MEDYFDGAGKNIETGFYAHPSCIVLLTKSGNWLVYPISTGVLLCGAAQNTLASTPKEPRIHNHSPCKGGSAMELAKPINVLLIGVAFAFVGALVMGLLN